MKAGSPLRLQRYLSLAGRGSRRKCEEFIRAGRVEVNGKIGELGQKVLPGKDRVKLDGERVRGPERPVVIMLNKPRGCLSTVSDEKGRPTVLDLLPRLPCRLFPVGRLDWNTTGLLLLTNDGDLAHRLSSPRSHVEKVYRVRVSGDLSEAARRRIQKGEVLDRRRLAPCKIQVKARRGNTTSLLITLRQGRYRQIRRVFAKNGHPVRKIQRLAVGGLSLGSLPSAKCRFLSRKEIERLGRPEGS